MMGKLRQIPPVGWIALAALAGVVFLCWHAYARDDDDTDWTTPKETQAPAVVPFPPPVPPEPRKRCWPDTLTSADASVIGEF